MCLLILIKCVIFSAFFNMILSAQEEDVAEENIELKSFIQLYDEGVKFYLQNSWEDCIFRMELSLDKYNRYYEAETGCRIECDYEIKNEKNKQNYLHPKNVEDLQFFEMILKRTLCLGKCKRKTPEHHLYNSEFDEYYKDIFRSRKPYEYLHYCYFRENEFEMAASAALTYMVQNPDSKIMLDNFNRVMVRDDINKNGIRDLEERKFVAFYLSGYSALQEEKWEETVKYMESSLYQFILDENQCRAFCDGDFDHGWFPDFISSIGNHFANTLYCKQNCSNEMVSVRGQYYGNLFASHYEVLHTAYTKLNKYEDACKAAVTYLLFNEDDPEMLIKLEHVKTLKKVGDKHFIPRSDGQEYYDRRIYENKLLVYIKTGFSALVDEEPKIEEDVNATGNGKHDEL